MTTPAAAQLIGLVQYRDSSYAVQGEIGDFNQIMLIPRFNEVGYWELTLGNSATATRAIAALQLAGAGIVVLKSDGTVLFSGPVWDIEHHWSPDEDKYVISGPDDNWWIGARLASPQPATSAPPYNSTAYDVRTGQASAIMRAYVNVNLGAGAIAARILSGLTLAADPALGATLTGRGRWQNLLELVQTLAISGSPVLGFKVIQSGNGITFSIYQPTDLHTTVRFSPDLGNVREYTRRKIGPDSTYAFVGGGGAGTARVVVEGSSSAGLASYGRIEEFVDRRDVPDDSAGELTAQAVATMALNTYKNHLEIVTVDTDALRFTNNYNLGDQVEVQVDSLTVDDVIRAVTIIGDAERSVSVQPLIGSLGITTGPKYLTTLDDITNAINHLGAVQ